MRRRECITARRYSKGIAEAIGVTIIARVADKALFLIVGDITIWSLCTEATILLVAVKCMVEYPLAIDEARALAACVDYCLLSRHIAVVNWNARANFSFEADYIVIPGPEAWPASKASCVLLVAL